MNMAQERQIKRICTGYLDSLAWCHRCQEKRNFRTKMTNMALGEINKKMRAWIFWPGGKMLTKDRYQEFATGMVWSGVTVTSREN
jgi:hypothetical protein